MTLLNKVSQNYSLQNISFLLAIRIGKTLFLIQSLAIILIMNFSTNSFAENLATTNTSANSQPNSVEDSKDLINTNNILKIIDKAASDKTSNSKNDTNQPKNANNSISKTISSLMGKKLNDPSLMFGSDEIDKIEQAITAHQNNQSLTSENKTPDKGASTNADGEINSCYLGSILYHSPDNWATWINGKKITSSSNKIGDEIYVKSINENNVSLVWTMSISKWKILADQKSVDKAPVGANNQVELNFNLSFNQTYILNGSKIIEGKIILPPSTLTQDHDKSSTDILQQTTNKQ